jgi:hypothetical protein
VHPSGKARAACTAERFADAARPFGVQPDIENVHARHFFGITVHKFGNREAVEGHNIAK